ncbi:MAG: hypothetical protein WD225_05165, partial [Ilumatobacteraceae bacterium]
DRRDFHLGAVIANRVLPSAFTRPAAATSARALATATEGDLADEVAGRIDAEPDVTRAALAEIAARFHDVAVVANREAERRTELAERSSVVLTAPALDRDINDVGDLLALADHLRSDHT